MINFRAFQTESNLIEGIHRVRDQEVDALQSFVEEELLFVHNMVDYVRVCDPKADLRSEHGMNVKVGNYRAPRGGPHIVNDLRSLLAKCNEKSIFAWEAHVAYELLHPFTDCNGLSGRALWLWMMKSAQPSLFLQRFYFQTLDSVGR
jgi:hypothetical protein